MDASSNEMVFSKMVGMRVVEARKASNLSQQDLASKSGVSIGAVSRVENGHGMPNLNTLWRIAGALNCAVKSLLPLIVFCALLVSGCSSRSARGELSPMAEVAVLAPEARPGRCNLCGGEIQERMWQFGDWVSDGPSIYHVACSMPEDPDECDYVGYLR